MIKVLLADDHALMREGLRQILGDVDDVTVIGEATTGSEVVLHPQLAHAHVILLDMSMPGYSGVELIREVCRRAPQLGVLVLTMHNESHYALRVMQAGAHGYLTKETASGEIVDAIKKIASGRRYISQLVSDQLAMEIAAPRSSVPYSQLSSREQEIFTLLVDGSSLSNVALALDVSVKTVSTFKTRIFQKMGMSSVAHMVLYALAHGMLAPQDRRRIVRAPPELGARSHHAGARGQYAITIL